MHLKVKPRVADRQPYSLLPALVHHVTKGHIVCAVFHGHELKSDCYSASVQDEKKHVPFFLFTQGTDS